VLSENSAEEVRNQQSLWHFSLLFAIQTQSVVVAVMISCSCILETSGAPQQHQQQTSRTVHRTVLSISSNVGDPSLSSSSTSEAGTMMMFSPPSDEVPESVAHESESSIYGMSTPSYEPLESQLQSPNVVITVPSKTS